MKSKTTKTQAKSNLKSVRPQQSNRGRERVDIFAQLDTIARNVWWSWNPDAMALFEYANPVAFQKSNHNPLVTLRKLTATQRQHLAGDSEFIAETHRVHGLLKSYLASNKTWYQQTQSPRDTGTIAYFCMEYGLHESLPLYAGGLGVLAGDHLKSASDLGLPFVAVGIYWKRGYTRQSIDKQGRQQDRFPLSPAADAPVEEVLDSRGQPIRIEFPLGDRTVKAGAYRLEVGRIPLYLLNTDLPENSSRDRKLVDVLYSGDRDMRIRQEILLGIGGWRLLRALKIKPAVYHLNEGHAAFLTLERLVERINQGKSFKQAMRSVANTSVFTTHTPVPAGNEEFDPALVDQYLSDYAELLGLSHTEFHDLARIKAGNSREPFGMTPLALRTSRYCNGVAKLHGEVARDMWKALYPGKPGKRVPIGHVTNGIHLKTWAHPEWSILLDEILGDDWESRQDSPATWKKIQQLPDDILWDFHNSLKAELIELCGDSFDPDALTIGFARRFATYKRAQLIFTQPARLAKIVNNPKRPVQIIFAGKAHPADTQGKAIIEQVVRYSREAQFRGKIYFVEDYEMGIGRQLTAGVDVWLNNPQRPREASGTSGMKPALHGGLNLSILDGWWPEAYNGKNGWAIGKGENYDGSAAADRRDAALLYEMLEKQVVPLYYDRDADGLPRGWIARMKNAIATIPPQFNMHRQVKEYLAKYYLPAMKNA